MRIRPRFLSAALAALPALAGCADTPIAPLGTPSFTATIRGSVQDEYLGAGHFQTIARPAGTEIPPLFAIFSSDGAGGQSFRLLREGADRPAPGRYPLAASAAGARRFAANYLRRRGDLAEGFTATEGELVVVVSTPDRVEGTFRFTGVRNCTGSGSSVRCTYPLDPTQPRVEVAGSFVAVRGGTPPAGGVR